MSGSVLSRVKLGLIVLASVVVLAVVALMIAIQGEPTTPTGYHIVNNSSTELDIFQVLSNGTEVLKLELGPGEEMDSQDPCGRVRMVARTPSGEMVATRGPFDECNPDAWVISPQDA